MECVNSEYLNKNKINPYSEAAAHSVLPPYGMSGPYCLRGVA